MLTLGGAEIDQVGGDVEHPELGFLPLACQHCADPACVPVCPTGATFKRDDGIVDIDADECIGCRSCIQACPYGVRVFNAVEASRPTGHRLGTRSRPSGARGVVEKCDFCVDLLEAGQLPMCIETCPARARYVGDLNDPDSEVSRLIRETGAQQLQPGLGTDPSVYYIFPSVREPIPTGLDTIPKRETVTSAT